MASERWQQIDELYHAARERGLAALADADADLRREVEQLLAQESGGKILDRPAAELLPDLIVGTAMAGRQLGPYRIESRLGAGGMGEVYRARDTRLNREVAIKICAERFSSRFGREAQAVAALNHPNICTLYDVGPNYLIMELINGPTLDDQIRKAALPFEQALSIARQIADALGAAHERGIVHRDLKPSNIMVRFDGYVKVLDFGLAKRISAAGPNEVNDVATAGVSIPGQILGTITHMSPEQLLGQEVDARSDLFAFGIILYEMVAGRHPWPANTAIEMMHAILHNDPPPIESPASGKAVPAAFQRIIRRCLEKRAAERFQTARELRAALDQAEVISKPVERQPSIAVLPFSNMSRDDDDEYFSDGLTEEVINALTQVPGLKVIARTSAFAFKGRNEDIRRIAQALGVTSVLEGSVRRAGSRLRVTADLIHAADGTRLWSQRYDRELADVFALQDEIAAAIAAALKIKLAAQLGNRQEHTPNLAAYEALLRGRHEYRKLIPDSIARGRRYLEQAIALDPGYALAYCELGGYFLFLTGPIGRRLPTSEALPLIRAAEQKALEIDRSLPDALAVMGVAAFYDYDWEDAGRLFRLALSREPVSPEVRARHGAYCWAAGRLQEAIEEFECAIRHDPLNLYWRALLMGCLLSAGRETEAAEGCRSILEIDENYSLARWYLSLIHAHQGNLEDAIRCAEKAYNRGPSYASASGRLAALLRLGGQAARAASILQKLGDGTAYGAPLDFALYHLLCSEIDEAMDWIEKAIGQRDPLLLYFLRFPSAKNLWLSPRWPKLARMMNLPETR